MSVMRDPRLAVGLVVLYFARSYLPDPWVWFRTARQVSAMETLAAANSANVTVRRDLARLYLERGRPGRALEHLAQARLRAPEQGDLLMLTGMALLKKGDAAAALDVLLEAVHRDPRIAFGEPYRLAGEALLRLGRLEDAEEAFEHYLDHNSSSLEAWFKIHDLRARQGRRDEARAALDELFSTWRQLPNVHRRRQWIWWARALPSRLFG